LRIVAILATYNEERFIAGCLDHLLSQGVEAYVCDNDSTDATVAIASRYLGAGVRGIERLPRDGTFRWRRILERKEELAAELDADWFIHLDADEIPLPPPRFGTLAEAFGTPNPCLEAAACGLPVLTTRVGNMPELIRDGENGFFVERDAADIARRLTDLREDPDLRVRMGRSARAAVEAWDWRHQAANYDAMFRAVLAPESGGPAYSALKC
jgi:glycosyltransferase involved in cell wall biosynthesis